MVSYEKAVQTHEDILQVHQFMENVETEFREFIVLNLENSEREIADTHGEGHQIWEMIKNTLRQGF